MQIRNVELEMLMMRQEIVSVIASYVVFYTYTSWTLSNITEVLLVLLFDLKTFIFSMNF